MSLAVGPGSMIDEWTIEGRLGEGGMASVFVAADPDGKRVALKVLGLEDELTRQRFIQEGRLLAQLRHPHLVQVFASGSSEGTPWLAMELLSGRTLKEVMSGRAFSLEEALPLFSQLADALGALHRARIVHRDLKPTNVMVSDEGWVTLLDLGIAREGEGGLTRTGMVFGTPGYMAPEQILADKNITPAADVYAFAVILWRALTGHPPFRARGEALMMEHLNAPRPVLHEARPGLPPALSALFTSALAVIPEQRPQTMGALWEELERALEGTTRVPTQRTDLAWLQAPPPVLTGAPEVGAPTRSDRRPPSARTSAELSPVVEPTRPEGREPPVEATGAEVTPVVEPTKPEGRALPLAPLNAVTAAELAPVVVEPTHPHGRALAAAEPTQSEGRALALAPLNAETSAQLQPVASTHAELEPVAPPPTFTLADERTLWGLAIVLAMALVVTLIGLFIDNAPGPPPASRIETMGPPPPTPQPDPVPEATPDILARREVMRAKMAPATGVGRDGFSIDKVREVKPRRVSTQTRSGGRAGGAEIVVLLDGRPVHADVSIDGRFAGVSPVATSVGKGKHVGRVDLDQHLPTTFEFWSTGQPLKLEIELTPLR